MEVPSQAHDARATLPTRVPPFVLAKRRRFVRFRQISAPRAKTLALRPLRPAHHVAGLRPLRVVRRALRLRHAPPRRRDQRHRQRR